MIEVGGKFYFVTVEHVLENLGIQVHKVQGHNLMLCCPIHGERNPSFGIHMETGLYQCFSCGARGNIINLICEIKGCNTLEATKYLSSMHTNNRAIPKISVLNTKNNTIALPENTSNEIAVSYLKTRGISEQIVNLFNIYSEKDCVVFPIYSIRGKAVSYQKRFISHKKFMFAPGFDKNNNIYGLNVLREYGDPKKPLFITESIIDCLTVWEYGGQAVSIFSAHMTREHVKLLAQTPFRIIADGLDRDLAGRLGWERATSLLLEKGFRTKDLKDHNKKDINELSKVEFENWSRDVDRGIC